MRLPNAQYATIKDAKLTAYLLSTVHPRGRAKARFLRQFGFEQGSPETLRDALLKHARDNDVARTIETTHGIKFEVAGPMPTPNGRIAVIKSVWIIDHGSDVPRFVTALPGRRQS